MYILTYIYMHICTQYTHTHTHTHDLPEKTNIDDMSISHATAVLWGRGRVEERAGTWHHS